MNKWLLLCLLGLLTGCVSTPSSKSINTANLSELESLRNSHSYNHLDMAKMREQALADTAKSLGARGALAFRSQQINQILIKDTPHLDKIYHFDAFVLDNNVLPPVLVEARSTENLASDDSLRLADRTYKILQQARFITRPPNWRDYLEMNYAKPDAPDKSLLPKNATEQVVWKKNIALGWQQGISQANDIFNNQLATLNQDYNGMALYIKLLSQNMVSPPFVAKTALGITGDNSNMRINDQILRIAALPSLNQNGKAWQAAVDHGN